MEKLKVKDLILILNKFDSNLPVASSGHKGCSDWLKLLDKEDVYKESEEYVNWWENSKDNCKKIKCLVIG